MDTIAEFKNLHQGKPCCVLANGPSLFDLLPRIPEDMLTIGMNASMSHRWSPYWVGLDTSTLWMAVREGYKPDYAFLPKAEGMEEYYEYKGAKNILIPTCFGKQWQFSQDLEKVIYTGRATIWFCIQLAVYMGFDPIFLVGFDLGGPRPKGHVHADLPMEEKSIMHQLQLMGVLRRMLDTGEIKSKIYNCATESQCSCLPYHVPVDEKDWRPITRENFNGKET